MGRSLKKGPFADAHLLNKVREMNEKDDKKVIKTYRGGPPFSLKWSAI